jgi:arylsulfatase A-like enzyme
VDFPQPNNCKQFDADTHVKIRQNYSAMVENIDRWLGIYIQEVEKRGGLDNTLTVYSSDHGEMLGDHNRWAKGVPYQPSVRVPLVVWGTDVAGGVVSDGLVSTMDLTATFLDFARIPVPAEMDGTSLKSLLAGETKAHREYVFSGLNDWRMVFDGRYKLIQTEGKKPVLYDLVSDPLENEDIADRSSKHVERLAKLLLTRSE